MGIPGLRLPVFPSNGNFLILECHAAKLRPEALCAAFARRNILVRQGAYHTARFGDRFIKISTTVPSEWVDELCGELSQVIEEARGMNEDIQLY